MTVLWSKCGDIVYTVVIVWCHCGGTVGATCHSGPYDGHWSGWAVRWWRSGDTKVTVGRTVGRTVVIVVPLWSLWSLWHCGANEAIGWRHCGATAVL